MREIKFRAWDTSSDEMLNDISTNTDDYTDMLNETFKYWQNHSLILMQYTNLKDKNGKEIYEGDILKFPKYPYKPDEGDNPYQLEAVVWKYTGFYIDDFPQPYELSNFDTVEETEVVSNIYQNPELLNSK